MPVLVHLVGIWLGKGGGIFRQGAEKHVIKVEQRPDKGNVLIKSLFGLCYVFGWSLFDTLPKTPLPWVKAFSPRLSGNTGQKKSGRISRLCGIFFRIEYFEIMF
ncbi:hypothetical protein A3860_14120 [Niastella vici]|uniref:Uncharacterized protein n=1 Tax=Niastella vici TaxID=1703345 RepID=A0A1V9G539_9BACT|nr:hypothetical protein A3860_14120 [Niastella vici]